MASRVSDGTVVGREWVRQCVNAGFGPRPVEPEGLLRDFVTADQILGLRRNAAWAVAAGAIH